MTPCPVCGTPHRPEMPHNPRTLTFQRHASDQLGRASNPSPPAIRVQGVPDSTEPHSIAFCVVGPSNTESNTG